MGGFCEDHWNRLRVAVEEEGLGELIAKSGERAATNTQQAVEKGCVTLANFDPLMGAHWAIMKNAMSIVGRAGSPLYLMGDGEEDPVEIPGGEGRTWPRCPLCYLGLAHELTCKDGRCSLPKVDGYAWMIDRAAKEQREKWEALKAEETGA